MDDASDLVRFWFAPLDGPWDEAPGKTELWFRKSDATDALLRERFGARVEQALGGELEAWDTEHESRLALLLLLDQLTRNLFRGTPRAFEGDPRARAISLGLVDAGADRAYRGLERVFLYLPLEHAEDPDLQARSVSLFEALHAEAPEAQRGAYAVFLDYARRHADVIARFGRFPHRNAILGRESSPEEVAYLNAGGGF